MLFNVSHQETKYEQGYNEGYHRTDQQAGKLHSRECKSELQYLQKTRSKHNGNRQKEAPERDVPGSAAATSWQKPMINASL